MRTSPGDRLCTLLILIGCAKTGMSVPTRASRMANACDRRGRPQAAEVRATGSARSAPRSFASRPGRENREGRTHTST